MSPRTLFSIILKITGIIFLKDILLGIPQFIGFLTYSLDPSYGIVFSAMAFFILSIGANILTAYFFIFKTDWIIWKLRLAEGYEVDPIKLTIHRTTVLSICIIVIGALMIVHAFPLFIREAMSYYQQAKFNNMNPSADSPDKSFLITYILQIIFGLLLMGNQRQIVNFIELRRRNKASEAE